MLAPLAAVLLFLLVIMVVFAYLRFEEIAREREAINRDIEYTSSACACACWSNKSSSCVLRVRSPVVR